MNIQNIIDEWDEGKKWIDQFTRDFPDLDNLADGVALSNVEGSPRVGDVRLANAVRQIPRASIQQMPTFSAIVNGTKLSIDAVVASFLLRSVVFNEDTFGTGILSTLQISGESALTRGFQALMAGTGKLYNQFGTTLKQVHYSDLVIEPGVFDGSDSSYYHVRTRVTQSRLDSIIEAAEVNEDTLWNVEALKKLKAAGPDARNYNTVLSTPRTNPGMGDNKQFDIITRFGVGPYHGITIYSPQISDEPLMEYKSRSKFGFPRVALLVLDPAQLLPFGISRARLASPYANYANIYLQSTAKMQMLNADPPIFRKGTFTEPPTLRRGAEWESVDTNADVRLVELGNSTLQQFNQVLDFIGVQIDSVMGIGDAGDQSNSAYQNTEAVKNRSQIRNRGSAQVTAILENAVRQYGLTALDLFISEQTTDGDSKDVPLVIDDEAKNAINRIEPPTPQMDATGQPVIGPDSQPVMVPFVGDDNVIYVNWNQFYDRIQTLSVTIDMSLSKMEMEDKKRADIQDTFTVMKQTAGDDPAAHAQANALGDELIQQTLPEMAQSAHNEVVSSQPYGGEMMPPQGQ